MDSPKKTPVIAIVGRTNVGKSTLFNKLIERRKAIVSKVPGTTQDINFGACAWRDRIWTVIDTAGLDFTRQKAEENRIRHQAQMAMDKADLILFVVSAQDGLLPEDVAFAKHLLKSKKPVVFIANKADSPKIRRNALESEWMKTGFGLPWALSATNGTGVGDMLDAVYEIIKDVGEGEEMPKPDVKITLIGRPNVGKSSLLNALAGEDRVIVSEVAHTTKEPQDTMLTFIDDHGVTRNLLFVDTVGIRKKANVERGIEKIGVSLSLDQLKNSDVIMIVFDAMVGISMQEKRLLGLAAEKNKSIIIIVNKWDLARDADTDAIIYEKHVQSELPFCKWAPIVFVSAKDGRHTSRLPQLALDVVEQHRRIIPQEQLDAFTEKIIKQHHAIAEVGYHKRRPKIFGIVQERTEPPRFTVIVDDEEKLAAGMLGFIENRLRTEFGFNGTDIRMEGRELKKRG